jgi:hypothetical protein
MKNAGRHVNVTLLNKFKDKFNKDEAGKSRNWRQIEEDEIASLFKKTRIEIEGILEQFKKIELPANITEMIENTGDEPDKSSFLDDSNPKSETETVPLLSRKFSLRN